MLGAVHTRPLILSFPPSIDPRSIDARADSCNSSESGRNAGTSGLLSAHRDGQRKGREAVRYKQQTLNPGDEIDLTVEPGEQCRVIARPCPEGTSAVSPPTPVEPSAPVSSILPMHVRTDIEVHLAPGQSIDLRPNSTHYHVVASACIAPASAGTAAHENDRTEAGQSNRGTPVEEVDEDYLVAAVAAPLARDVHVLQPHMEHALAENPTAFGIKVPFEAVRFHSPYFGECSMRMVVQVERHGGATSGGR